VGAGAPVADWPVAGCEPIAGAPDAGGSGLCRAPAAVHERRGRPRDHALSGTHGRAAEPALDLGADVGLETLGSREPAAHVGAHGDLDGGRRGRAEVRIEAGDAIDLIEWQALAP
jgi:hypothetical protein